MNNHCNCEQTRAVQSQLEGEVGVLRQRLIDSTANQTDTKKVIAELKKALTAAESAAVTASNANASSQGRLEQMAAEIDRYVICSLH